MNTKEIKRGQDVEISFNNKREKQKFCVFDITNDLIQLKAHIIGHDEIYDISIKVLPTMWGEGSTNGGLIQELPENMTRVLIEHNSGTLEFAFYKDGMFKCESGEIWMTPKAVRSWMQISELKKKVGL